MGLRAMHDSGDQGIQTKHEQPGIRTGLESPYTAEKAKLIVREMTDALVLDLVEKNLVTDQIVLTIGYDIENLTDAKRKSALHG